MALVRYTATFAPGQRINVYFRGTLDLAVLYEDLIGTLLGNPTTADLVTGDLAVYAEEGIYTMSSVPTMVPLTITITTPVEGATVSGLVPILTHVTGPVRAITLAIDGVPITSPWDSRTVPDGNHFLSAVVEGVSGQTASAGIVVIVRQPVTADVTPPVVHLSTPAVGAPLPEGATTITATATDAVGVVSVVITVDSVQVGPTFTAPPYSTSWAAVAGAHTILVTAADAAGNIGTATLLVTVVAAPPADTTAPTVAWTTPHEGDLVALNAVVPLVATAADNVGVASVHFVADGVLIGSPIGAPPYQTTWTAATIGTHTLQAVAVDAAGNSTSAIVHVTVPDTTDRTPPVVTIVSPAAGLQIPSGATPIQVTATDNVSVTTVEILVDGTRIGAIFTTPPYTVSWTATVGTHTILARATDAAANLGSATLILTVADAPPADTTPPVVAFTTPTEGEVVALGNVPLAATATDNDAVTSVQFLVDGAVLGAADTSAPYQATWPSTLGAHTLQAVAIDPSGNTAMALIHVSVLGTPDTTPPVVTLLSPATGATIHPGDLQVSASATDNIAVTSVQFFAGGQPIGAPLTAAPYVVTWSAVVGTFILLARATDAAGNVGSASVTAVVTAAPDTTPPTVTFTSPHDGDVFLVSPQTITIAATAFDNNGLPTVQFLVDGVQIGAILIAPYQLTWTTSVGAHTLTAIATDGSGNTATATIHVTVQGADTTPPVVALTFPASGAILIEGTLFVTATATDNGAVASVQFYLNNAPLGAAVTVPPYRTAWTAAVGTYTLKATATDTANNTATTPDTPVTVVAVSGTASATFDGQDTTTQGDWIGVYGHEGYGLAKSAINYPSYASVTPSASAFLFTYLDTTTDVRALQRPDGLSRISATWFSKPTFAETFSFEVIITDAGTHRIAIYSVDWDHGGRGQRIDITDAAGVILDSRQLTSFENGTYLRWLISGHVRIVVTNVVITGPPPTTNAVVSGLFFGPAGAPLPQPLSVTLTFPHSGALLLSGNIVVTADVTGPVASVQFYVNAVPLGAPVLASPWQTTWAATAGTFTLTAIVTGLDTSTATSPSVAVTIIASIPYPDASILRPSDFTYLGYYDVRYNDVTSNSAYTQGLAFRHIVSTGSKRLATIENGLHELSLDGRNFGDLITEPVHVWPFETIPEMWGDGYVGLWWASESGEESPGVGNLLYTVSCVDYTLAAPVLIYSRLFYPNNTASPIRGPVGLQGVSFKQVYGGMQPTPYSFRNTFGGGPNAIPYVCGWGGYTSLVEQSQASMGLAMYAIPDPAAYAPHTEIPSTLIKRCADHESGDGTGDWYNGTGLTVPNAYDRGQRIISPINYFDGGDPRQNPPGNEPPDNPPLSTAGWLSPAPDGYGRMVWGDSYFNTGCWIFGPERSGFIAIMATGTGRCWYGGSTTHYDGFGAELHIYDPKQFGEVTSGVRPPWAVQPVGMLDLAPLMTGYSRFSGLWAGGGTVGRVSGAAYDHRAQRLYVMCPTADSSTPNRLHVFQVNAGNAYLHITSPLNGATVSGTVTIQLDPSPEHQLLSGTTVYIDGPPYKDEFGGPNWSIEWDTTDYVNGVHTIQAASHLSGSTITVTVAN